MKTVFMIGRIMFGGFFLYNGIDHLVKRKELAQYAASKHVPQPEAAVIISGLAQVLGGTSIALGTKPKVGTTAILAFLAATSPVIHNFWKSKNSEEYMHELVNFSKNMALLGAALGLMGVKEPWPRSLEVSAPLRVVKGIKAAVAA